MIDNSRTPSSFGLLMQSEILVEAAQHQHELLLLIPPLPMPTLAEPFLGLGQELSAAFVAWDPHQGKLAASIGAAEMATPCKQNSSLRRARKLG
jgi:hypothetical protein